MLHRLWKILTSLRLTAVLLALSILLVFVGTVAQADEGLYNAQARYFQRWFVFGISFFGYRIPIPLPGGYLLGTLLLINLTAAHIQRFQWTRKKAGIHLTHAGIVLLLAGQLVTDMFSNEGMMRFSEGESKNYSESAHYELVFISDAGADTEEVIAIPERLLANEGEIKSDKMPFSIRVKKHWINSEPSFRAPTQQNAPPLTTNGIAQHFDFRPAPPVKTMNERNIPTALIEILTPGGSLGEWVASDWAGEERLPASVGNDIARRLGVPQMAGRIASRLAEPQSVEVAGKKFTFAIRPERTYRPYVLTLLNFTHARYPGTDIPKDFRSRVRLQNPQTSEKRELDIYMNSPLRYKGETFYQASFDENDPRVSILQVVRNPGWLTPYAGCIIVALGLVTQFMIHLIGFISKRKAA